MKSGKLIYLIFALLCSINLVAQKMEVTGKVIDEISNPIIGASVLEKGTTNGTVSDINGNFTLSVEKNSILSISYIGYLTREIEITEGGSLEVILQEDTEVLDEVIIVGTSIRKSDLTGAVSSVSAEVLAEKPVTNINQALQGRVAGVFISSGARPSDDSQIKIRGINTINGSTDPIYVVDGMVMDNAYAGFNAVNLNDVASIEVLKDASATALYGSRGSNGVVLITTKKGRRGEGKVTYDGWVGIQNYAKVPKTMDTRQLFELRKEAYVNGYMQTNPNGNVEEFIENEVMGSNRVFADYEFESYQNNRNYNWLDEVSRTGVQQNHLLSFSNASDRGAFYLSFGYSDNKGLIKKTGQEKYSGRINADQNIKPWLKVGTNSSFTRTMNSIVSDGVMNRARNANPMLPISDEIQTLNWQGIFDQNNFNPLRSLRIDNDLVYNRFMSSNFIDISFLENFNFRTTFSLDYAQRQQNEYIPNDIYEAERYGTQGQATDNRDERTVWQWDNTLSYDKVIDEHRINALIGTSATQTNGSWINASAQGFGSNLFSYHSLNSGYKRDQRGLSSSWWKATLLSYILRANYGYDGRYLLTATARYDGSSKFAKGHQWGIFPSLSAAWNITEEEFMESQDLFDQLKFRAGFGVVGNQNISDFAYLSLYHTSYTGTSDTGYTYSFVSDGRRGTENISWEKQRQWNIGLDMTALNNRINFSVDAFMIKNKDLLMSHSLPTTSGYTYTIENIGAIENKGIEFSLGATLIQTRDFEWNLSGTLSLDKNKVTQLYGNADVVYNVDGDRNIQKEGNLFLGESRNTIYIWRTGGIAQEVDMERLSKINWQGYNVNPGDLYPLDANDDGQIDQNDRVVIGSTDPKFYGGFATDLTWKGLSLNAVFNYSYGARRLSPYYESLIGSKGSSNASIDLLDRWTPDNTTAEFPRVLAGFDYNHYGAHQMDFSVQDASYLRLSALTLSYNLPQSVLSKLNVSNLRVYTTGSNLFCLTNYKGYDPETGDWYPPTKMYVVGVNFSF
ncbi:SusC/RagA family TonB-linked outer membrane protein [Proteiniphilum acetatigenes]|uniref:SusC/RagA family TonB-linked outer membrane protein n=1 Tax=Proteiniphilum acetatigenes TaxID=294710 RepID=UPI0003A2AEF0|nr:TonB-dependent receptor [Proteiniphilum acetatigenes]